MKTIETIKLNAHTKDCFDAEITDSEGKLIARHSGYVPSWMPGGGGDDITLIIDNATGKIINWVPVVHSQIVTDEICTCFDQCRCDETVDECGCVCTCN